MFIWKKGKKHIVSEGECCRKCYHCQFFLRVRMTSYCSDRSCNKLVEVFRIEPAKMSKPQHCIMFCLIVFIFFNQPQLVCLETGW